MSTGDNDSDKDGRCDANDDVIPMVMILVLTLMDDVDGDADEFQPDLEMVVISWGKNIDNDDNADIDNVMDMMQKVLGGWDGVARVFWSQWRD